MTDEDKKELRAIVETVLDERRKTNLERTERERSEDASSREERLYLLSFPGHIVAIPDEQGRAILSQCFYAWIKVRRDNPQFYSGEVRIVALGDGRVFKEPYRTILNGSSVAMVEVAGDFLEKLKQQAIAAATA